MEIVRENKEGVEKVKDQFPFRVGCVHCDSCLRIVQQDTHNYFTYADHPNNHYAYVICPCCNLPTPFGF